MCDAVLPDSRFASVLFPVFLCVFLRETPCPLGKGFDFSRNRAHGAVTSEIPSL
jgi:hypothetical protein